MDKPMPDGYISVRLGDVWQSFHFKYIDTWRTGPEGLTILYDKLRRTIPWHNIAEYTVHYNSNKYREAAKAYQEAHNHQEWEQYTTSPLFDQPTHEICSGEEGCGFVRPIDETEDSLEETPARIRGNESRQNGLPGQYL